MGCANRDTKETRAKGIKFYRIPVNLDKRRLWLAAMQRKDFNSSPDAAICSVHFIGGKYNIVYFILICNEIILWM